MGPDVEDVMTEARLDGAASAVERRVRDAARDAWYDGINKGTPYHWRDVGPDEIWAAAWEAATNRAATKRAPKPRELPQVGTGALLGEQQFCFEKGWKEGIAALRRMLRSNDQGKGRE